MLFGSKKIPELARGLGKGIREFKNATSDIQEEIRKTSSEITKTTNDIKKDADILKNVPDELKSKKPKS